MSRLPLLPKWALPPTMPSIYDTESATALEMVAKVYGAMSQVVDDYNQFADQINNEIQTFTGSTSAEIANFKKSVEERLRCKFNSMDAHMAWIRQEMKQYTDSTLEKAFYMFGATTKAIGEALTLSDAADEKIRALSIYGKTEQAFVPDLEHPAELESVGDDGLVTVRITNGTDEQLLHVSTPEGLPGIPVSEGGNYTDSTGQAWICDEIDLARGVYIKRVNKMLLDGNETISTGSWAKCFVIFTKSKNPEHMDNYVMSSFLPAHYNYQLADGTYDQGIATHGAPNLMVKFGDDVTTLDQAKAAWKNIVSAGGQVYTLLVEPVERPLTAAELAAYKKLHTYMPETTITASGAGLMVEYVAIMQKYIERILPGLATDQPARIAVSREGQTITVTEQMADGTSKNTVIALDANDYPVTITKNGTEIPVEWSGFDA